MEINCTITRSDCWQFYRYALLRQPARRWGIVIVFLALALWCAVGEWALQASWTLIAITAPLAAALLLAAIAWILKARVMRTPADGGSTLGEHYVAVGREGVVCRTKSAQSLVHWSGILDVAENKRYLFLLVDAQQAIVVPKRAFERKEDAKAFVDAARAYWRETKDAPPPVDRYGYPLIGR
ncbi:MAG TPA: YcxB family protein [Terriglobia bacterium]|nr:YcxB family protein [Terriglobia bacterium]